MLLILRGEERAMSEIFPNLDEMNLYGFCVHAEEFSPLWSLSERQVLVQPVHHTAVNRRSAK